MMIYASKGKQLHCPFQAWKKDIQEIKWSSNNLNDFKIKMSDIIVIFCDSAFSKQ